MTQAFKTMKTGRPSQHRYILETGQLKAKRILEILYSWLGTNSYTINKFLKSSKIRFQSYVIFSWWFDASMESISSHSEYIRFPLPGKK